jgi:Siphovirus Gp157
MKNLELVYLQQEITQLLLTYPELETDEVLRADNIEGQTGAFEFLSKIVREIGATKALREGTVGYRNELDERIARLERREYALRTLIFKVMGAAELKRCELSEATLSIRTGQQKVVIVDERDLPEEFIRIKREPDKVRIKAALTAREEVPGAALSNAEPVLAIAIK